MFFTRNDLSSLALSALFGAVLPAVSTRAEDVIKANNAQALNLAASWVSGVSPGEHDRAVFDQSVTGNKTTSLGADAAWSGIALTDNSATWSINGAYTLSLGSGGLDLAQAAANFALVAPLNVRLAGAQTWTVASGRQITVSGFLSGGPEATLVKEGGGTLVINTNSFHEGGMVLNSGVLAIGNGEALGVGPLILNGGILRASSGGHVVSNALVLNGAAAVNNTVTFTLAGDISGSGSLTRAQGIGGTLYLGGSNMFSGGTTNGSVIQINAATALGSGPVVLLSGGTLQAGPGVFGTGNSGGFKNDILLAGYATLGGGQNLLVSGVVSGEGSLRKSGTGDLVLSGKNTFSGGTTNTQGRIRLGNVNGLGTGTLVMNGGILVANANLSSGNGGKGVTNPVHFAASGILNSQGNSVTLSGTISGSGQLRRNSGPAGVLTLSGDNTFSGGLTNMSGTLVLGHVNALGTGRLDIHEGTLSAALALTEGRGVTNDLAISNTNGFGTVLVGGLNDLRLSGVISGTSDLTKIGSGVLFLGGSNTFSGATVVSNGILAFDAGGSVNASPHLHVGAGARLDVSGIESDVTVPSNQLLTGFGSVTGSVTLASGSRISAGTTNEVGTLTFLNNLTLGEGVVIDWNADSASGVTDLIRVRGTLFLPEHATIQIRGTGSLPRLRFLFQSPNIVGAHRVRNWTVLNGPQNLRATPTADGIALRFTGLVVSLR